MCKCLSAGVTIGLQQSDITVNESVGSVEICAVIKCGCIRRDVAVTLDVQGDATIGIYSRLLWLYVCMIDERRLVAGLHSFYCMISSGESEEDLVMCTR